MTPPEFVADKRRMTPARRKRILERFDGCCARLDCTVTTGLEIDHIIPIALSGKDDDANLEPLCAPHHLAKTKRDVALIAKARRIVKKNTDPRPPSRLKSRGFEKPKERRPWPKTSWGYKNRVD